jgi:hypothetical protein
MLKQTVCTLTTVLYSIYVLSNVHTQTLGLQIHQSLYHHHSFTASYSKWYKETILLTHSFYKSYPVQK